MYEQDKKGTISADDREHYMALYTIINKLTKDDGKAAGQLVNQELDSTLGNLVTSYMIEKEQESLPDCLRMVRSMPIAGRIMMQS